MRWCLYRIAFFVCLFVWSAWGVPALDSSSFSLETLNRGVVVSWSPSESTSENVLIWRSLDVDGLWFIHEVVPATAGTYIDEDITPFQTYFYRIQGFEGEELSALSNELSAIVAYDGNAVVFSEADEALFDDADAYVDESLSEEEYTRRLALSNQKMYCDILSRGQIRVSVGVRALADCGGVRVQGSSLPDAVAQSLPLPGNTGSTGSKGLTIGGGSGGDDSESSGGGPGSGGNGDAGNGGDNAGGSAGTGAGGGSGGTSADTSGEEAGSSASGNRDPGPRPAGAPCDASYARIYGDWWSCAKKNYLEKERDNLELMKLELATLIQDLLVADEDTNESLVAKKERYERLVIDYVTKRHRYEEAQRKAQYAHALALEQYAMAFQARGDGERALESYEAARVSCLEAAELSAFKEEKYPARLCAARNALKHATLLGPKDPLLQDAQREYTNLAQEIDFLENPDVRAQFLPIAIDAYSGVMQAQMREGRFGVAESALKQIERLDPESGVTKYLRTQYELTLVDVIARYLDYASAEAYDLLNAKLRMDEGLATRAERIKVGAKLGVGDSINSFDLERLTRVTGKKQLRLNDEQIGLSLVRKAMLKGKTLQEIRDLNDAELAVLFETTDTKRAAAARGLMQKAFENVDVQEYLDGNG